MVQVRGSLSSDCNTESQCREIKCYVKTITLTLAVDLLSKHPISTSW